jgi:spermidine/putrescine-binding protein
MNPYVSALLGSVYLSGLYMLCWLCFWSRHIEEWLKKTDSMIEKLHLRTSTLRSEFARMNQLLKQEEVLGESLYPVDYEQLKIKNSQFIETVKQKTHNLLKMKKMAG